MRDMTEGELHAVYEKGQCPNCGGAALVPGPRGGAMVNVECAQCKMALNISQFAQLRLGQVLREVDGYVSPGVPGGGTQLQQKNNEKRPSRLSNYFSGLKMAMNTVRESPKGYRMLVSSGIVPVGAVLMQAWVVLLMAAMAIAGKIQPPPPLPKFGTQLRRVKQPD